MGFMRTCFFAVRHSQQSVFLVGYRQSHTSGNAELGTRFFFPYILSRCSLHLLHMVLQGVCCFAGVRTLLNIFACCCTKSHGITSMIESHQRTPHWARAAKTCTTLRWLQHLDAAVAKLGPMQSCTLLTSTHCLRTTKTTTLLLLDAQSKCPTTP